MIPFFSVFSRSDTSDSWCELIDSQEFDEDWYFTGWDHNGKSPAGSDEEN